MAEKRREKTFSTNTTPTTPPLYFAFARTYFFIRCCCTIIYIGFGIKAKDSSHPFITLHVMNDTKVSTLTLTRLFSYPSTEEAKSKQSQGLKNRESEIHYPHSIASLCAKVGTLFFFLPFLFCFLRGEQNGKPCEKQAPFLLGLSVRHSLIRFQCITSGRQASRTYITQDDDKEGSRVKV